MDLSKVSMTVSVSLGAIVASVALLSSSVVYAADVTAPVITANNISVECRGGITQVFIDPGVVDDQDPLPVLSFSIAGTASSDPYGYTPGQTAVDIQACDASGNCSTQRIAINITDTTGPVITAGQDRVLECTSPDGTPVILADPTVTDVCDAATVWVSDAPADTLYAQGSTTVTMSAADSQGNSSSDGLKVTIKDTQSPAVNAGPDMTTYNFANCMVGTGAAVTAGTGDGTWVRLPQPAATDACVAASVLLYGNSVNPDGGKVICAPQNTTTTVTWTIYDETGNIGTDAIDVTVVPGSDFGVSLSTTATGFRNVDATLTLTAVGYTGSVTWTGSADMAPLEIAPFVGSPFTLTFDKDGSYCPVYFKATDDSANTGVPAATPPCFAIDTVPPTHTFTGLTTGATIYYGAQHAFQVQARDDAGSMNSGIERVVAVVDPSDVNNPSTGTPVHDQSFSCAGTTLFGLPECSSIQYITACNTTGSLCANGLFQAGLLSAGSHSLYVYSYDQAGNRTSTNTDFFVEDLTSSFAQSITDVDALLSSPTTPIGALTSLTEARDLLNTAEGLLTELPGLTFLLARRAWTRLSDADAAGASTTALMTRLAQSVTGEARRYRDQISAQAPVDWDILATTPSDAATYKQLYNTRTFLMSPGVAGFTDYTVEASNILSLASGTLALADQYLDSGLTLEALDAALDAHDALVMLFSDNSLASLFSRATYMAETGIEEGYYQGSPPSRFGDYVAKTVSAQIARVATDPTIPAETVVIMGEVVDLMTTFSANVDPIKTGTFPVGYSNRDLTVGVYLTAQQALEKLQTIQGSSLYTYYWRAAIGLTIAYVVNFSVYEGTTALTRGLNLGGTVDPIAVAGSQFYSSDGTGTAGDPIAQVAECRYSAIMRDMSAGRIDAAMQRFASSKCVIIDLYNRYYAVDDGRYLPCDLSAGTGDCPIDPVAYGCTDPLPTFDLALECPTAPGNCVSSSDANCDGVDDDCDGVADDDYVATSCNPSSSPDPNCIGFSSCVNGVEVPCVAPSPPSSVDGLICDGADDDCDGQLDEDYIAINCGIGVCGGASTCSAGVETACVPNWANSIPEVCDGFDNDCDVLVDEGLDNDHDGYGCAPPVVNDIAWYSNEWTRRRNIGFDTTVSVSPWSKEIVLTFNNADQGVLNNFPVLVKLDSTRIDYAETQDQGQDIRFFDADGTPLNYEIEVWNESGDSLVWVKVPQIDGSSTTDFITMRYANPAAVDAQNAALVWDTDHVAVYHLNTDPGGTAPQLPDSTIAGNAMTSNGMTLTGLAAGYVGLGWQFDGTDDYAITPNLTTFVSDETITLEVWFNANAAGVIVDELGTTSVNNGWHDSQLEILANGEVRARVWNMSRSYVLGTVSFGSWHYAVLRYNKATQILDGFMDGVEAAGDISGDRRAPFESGYGLYYGLGATDTTNLGSGAYFDGLIDEFRVSKAARSADWIAGQRLSISDGFIQYGAPGFVPNAGENLNNFPVLLTLDASSIDYAAAQPDGSDLLFLDDDHLTVLNYEIESWNTAGISYVWVQVPRIDALSTTDNIWMYYGDTTPIAAPNASAVWAQNYVGVFHLNGLPYADASATLPNGTPVNITPAIGQVGGAIDVVAASSAYITLSPTGLPTGTASRTLCAWAQTNTTTGTRWIAAYGDEVLSDQAMFIGMDNGHLYGGASVSGYSTPAAWPKKLSLTFNNTGRVALTNFPVLVRLNGTRIDYADTQDQGQDIRFFDADGSPLSHEIEIWNESGDSLVWVKVPQIDAGSTIDTITMRYGNTTVSDGQDAANVWDASYAGVWHMSEDPSGTAPQMKDSSVNAFHMGTNGGVPATALIAAQLHQGVLLDGSNDYIITPDITSPFSNETVTTELWFRADAAGVVLDETGQSSINTGWHDSQIEVLSNGNVGVRVWDSDRSYVIGNVTINDGAWHHVVLRYDRTARILDGFLDGVEAGTDISIDRRAPFEYGNGQYYALGATDTTKLGTGDYLTGAVDEFRVSTVARSNDWLTAQYASMTDSFITYGAGGSTLPIAQDLIVPNFWDTSTWHHICLTYDGTDAALYADGDLMVTAARSWNLTATVARIGAQVSGTPAEFWDGLIDEVSFSDVARAPSWILSEYRTQLSSAIQPFAFVGVEETLPVGASNCIRTGTNDPRTCANDNGSVWDCNDADPDAFPGGEEVCDYKDNDCDGFTDEGVLNACGNCEPDCEATTVGIGGVPFNPTPVNSDSVIQNPDGSLGLTSSNFVDVIYAWTANDNSGTVSKLDTATGKEVARYCTALKNVARGESTVCGACGGCNRGSRTAVDIDGNVFVGNRGYSYQATLTKIANAPETCVDVNGNGQIDTSSDVNGNGVIDQSDPLEYLGEDDECILWTKRPNVWVDGSTDKAYLGEGGFVLRAVAIDVQGDVWIGNWRDQGFWELDPISGEVKRWVYMGIRPYGAVIDGQGILWAPSSCCGTGTIKSVNTTSRSIVNGVSSWGPGQVGPSVTQTWSDRGNYGIAVDGKNRVWLGSWPREGWVAARYDPSTNIWTKSPGTGAFRGRGLTVDPAGRVWVAQHRNWAEGRVTAFDVDTMAVVQDVITSPAGTIPVGVGIGTGLKVWAVNQSTANVTVIDPDSGVFATFPVGGRPYTYSDFTGNLLRTFTAPQGTYREVIEGCFGNPVKSWAFIVYNAITPGTTVVKWRVRVADTPAGLATAFWYPDADSDQSTIEFWLSNPVDLTALPAKDTGTTNIAYMEIEAILESDDAGLSPVLNWAEVSRNCDQQ